MKTTFTFAYQNYGSNYSIIDFIFHDVKFCSVVLSHNEFVLAKLGQNLNVVPYTVWTAHRTKHLFIQTAAFNKFHLFI